MKVCMNMCPRKSCQLNLEAFPDPMTILHVLKQLLTLNNILLMYKTLLLPIASKNKRICLVYRCLNSDDYSAVS